MTADGPSRKRLTRAMRLQKTREFTLIKNTGQRSVKGCMVANWMPLAAGSLCRLGLITSRKLGKASVRTRARRLLRETFRLHQHDFREPVAIVLIARASIIGKKLADVERDFVSLLRQADLLKKIE
jgi:ribonuclease P protein component